MKNYYYTDREKVAWMFKHHGMRFQHDVRNPCIPQPPMIIDLDSKDGVYSNPCLGRYFIHSSDLGLLEAREGDFVTSQYKKVGCVAQFQNSDGPVVFWAGREGHEALKGNERIIQRYGIPFFWPELDLD